MVANVMEHRGMLILTRRPHERIMVGDNIEISVLGVVGNQVRIGINAPRETQVHREEIYRRIKNGAKGEPHGGE